jgi:hypothetical protein
MSLEGRMKEGKGGNGERQKGTLNVLKAPYSPK